MPYSKGWRKSIRHSISEGVTASPIKRHYPALPLERVSELLARVDDYTKGKPLTRLAVMLTLHLFIRSSELRFARWCEFDFKNKIWTIPATREAITNVHYSGRGAKMCTFSAPLLAADPCKATGGGACRQAEHTFFSINAFKKRLRFNPGKTFEMRRDFLAQCAGADPAAVSQILSRYGRVRG